MGRKNKPNSKGKRPFKNSKQYSTKNRKTYSLYQQKTKSDSQPVKRKFEEDKDEPVAKKVSYIPESESDSTEEEDNVQQLLSTFDKVEVKTQLAIESDDEEDYEDEVHDTPETALSETENGTDNVNIEVENEAEIDPEEDIDQSNDPYIKHIQYDLSEEMLNSVQATPVVCDTHQENWPTLGNLVIQIPKCEIKSVDKSVFRIEEEQVTAPPGTVPHKVNTNKSTLESIFIKTQISGNVKKANKRDIDCKLPLTPLQAEMFSVLNNYQDFYYPARTFENGEEIRFVYCLHALNHIMKTRTKVIHHNARLSKKDDVPDEFRDQGLVRPKILMVVPFRDSAYRIIQMLIDLLIVEDKGNVINKHRFKEEFTGGELLMPKKNPKPEDYELLFSGNSGDDFKIGITVTKKSLKLYADFYSSDIIIASPLGLRTIIGAPGEAERDFDFLASIELLIFDQTDIFLMQNWDHVLHILNHLHLQPKSSHGTDLSRIRSWCLNGWAKYYRQTLIFSSSNLPEMNSIFNKRCFNYAGKVKAINPIEYGTIRQVYLHLPHVYQKFEAHNAAHAIDARFNFFVNKVLSQLREPQSKSTLIYVANYFDFVKLRNYFKKEDISFVQCCEYSKDAKVARARDMFFHGDAHFLLYTERFHFFNRKKIKGIRHLVFYEPPKFPHFYSEMCNLMQEGNMNKKVGNASNMSVNVLFCKYDVLQLSAIIGTERTQKLLLSEKNVHVMVTESNESTIKK